MVRKTICGGVVQSKRSLLALSWSITTLLSGLAFITALIFVVAIETKYETSYLNYEENYYNSKNNNDDDGVYNYNNDDYNGGGYNNRRRMTRRVLVLHEKDVFREDVQRWLDGDGDGDGGGDGGEGDGDGGGDDGGDDGGDGDGEGSGSGSGSDSDSGDDELFYAKALVTTSSSSMIFVVVYASALSLALGLYGSTAIVGFTSLTGRYIGPCFAFSIASKTTTARGASKATAAGVVIDSPSDGEDSLARVVVDDDTEEGDVDGTNVASMAANPCQNAANAARNVINGAAGVASSSTAVNDGGVAGNMHTGLFMGALLFFSNLLLICAVIFGEVRVEDYIEKEERQPYAIEVIATVLAVLFMFLAVLYLIFAVLMFVYYEAMLEEDAEEVVDGMTGGIRASINTSGANRANLVSSMLRNRSVSSRGGRRRRTDMIDHGGGGGKNEPLMYDTGDLGEISMVDVGASVASPAVLNSSKHGYLTSGVYG